jgi:hypothetical protein
MLKSSGVKMRDRRRIGKRSFKKTARMDSEKVSGYLLVELGHHYSPPVICPVETLVDTV